MQQLPGMKLMNIYVQLYKYAVVRSQHKRQVWIQKSIDDNTTSNSSADTPKYHQWIHQVEWIDHTIWVDSISSSLKSVYRNILNIHVQADGTIWRHRRPRRLFRIRIARKETSGAECFEIVWNLQPCDKQQWLPVKKLSTVIQFCSWRQSCASLVT